MPSAIGGLFGLLGAFSSRIVRFGKYEYEMESPGSGGAECLYLLPSSVAWHALVRTYPLTAETTTFAP